MLTSDPLRTTGFFVGSYPIASFIFNHFGSSFSIGKSYPLIDQPCSAFELVVFTIEACGICFHHTLMGSTYAFLNMCEPGNYYGSYSTGVMSDKISTHNFVEGEK